MFPSTRNRVGRKDLRVPNDRIPSSGRVTVEMWASIRQAVTSTAIKTTTTTTTIIDQTCSRVTAITTTMRLIRIIRRLTSTTTVLRTSLFRRQRQRKNRTRPGSRPKRQRLEILTTETAIDLTATIPTRYHCKPVVQTPTVRSTVS